MGKNYENQWKIMKIDGKYENFDFSQINTYTYTIV